MAIKHPTRRNARRRDLTGQVFNHLTVIELGEPQGKVRRWKCICRCGKETQVPTYHLRTGGIKSCGCLQRESVVTHGQSYGAEYQAWKGIKRRCYSKKSRMYKRYGGRGITVCQRWRDSFANFFADMGKRPSAKHSIERIDNNGNYEPSNCKWATDAEQTRNTSRNVYVEFRGERLTVQDWAKRLGVTHGTLQNRIKRWGVERALTTPVFSQYQHRKGVPWRRKHHLPESGANKCSQ